MFHETRQTRGETQPIVVGTSGSHVAMEFEPESYSVVFAKRFVSATLASWGLEHLEDDARLLTCELASNAIVHAATRFRVTIELDSSELRIAVLDRSPRLPTIPKPGPCSKSGRGLMILNALSSRHGVEVLDEGKEVWFTFSLDHSNAQRATVWASQPPGQGVVN